MTESIYERVGCVDCGIHYAIEQDVLAGWKKNNKNFFCPNGHKIHFKSPPDTNTQDSKIKELNEEVSLLEKKLKGAQLVINQKNKLIELLVSELRTFDPEHYTEDYCVLVR